jgi:hypothetical protein
MRRLACLILSVCFLLLPQSSWAQEGPKWVVSWAASAQGPYPVGNPSAQPDQRVAFPVPAATLDPQTGGLKPEFVPDSTIGGPGDKLHPDRAGYLGMGMAIDLELLNPKQQARR